MSYGKRIDYLCSFLRKAETIADVGCDHGYLSEYALKNALCKKLVFSDIAKGSLEKAKKLLAPYVENGTALPVLGNGFFGVGKDTEEVVIAGMGGIETITILSDEKYGFMPPLFLFQPMHNPEKLRSYLLENGGFIERDETFFADGKFYDLIVGRRRRDGEDKQVYTPSEREFGRDNIREMGSAFQMRCEKFLKNSEEYLKAPLQEKSRQELLSRVRWVKEVLSGEIH